MGTGDSQAELTVKPRQRAVLVLGAGRSGTSIITRALQAVGVELGEHFKPPSRKNPTGFFEDAALLKLSKQLRRKLGLRPDSLRLLEDTVWDGPDVAPFYPRFAATINARFGNAPIWGFKYARSMRLLPFWLRLFKQMNIEASFVMPIRNPLSVARSRAKLDAHRGGQANSDLEWLVNVVPYFQQLAASSLVVVDYDRLMANPQKQLQRLARNLGLPLNQSAQNGIDIFCTDFLKPGLRHTSFSIEALKTAQAINPLLTRAYVLLDRMAVDELSSHNPELYSQWAEINAGVEALRPILARLDALERQLRLAQWNPLSPLGASLSLFRKLYNKL